MINNQVPKDKVALIYNKMSHDSLIAAAILHSSAPDTYMPYELGDNLPEGYHKHLWLGVQPSKAENPLSHLTCIALQGETSVEDGLTDLTYHHTVMDLCLGWLPEDPLYATVAYHVACFHDKHAEISQLALVHELIQRADKHLRYHETFTMPDVSLFFDKQTQQPYIDAYKAEMKRVEPLLNQSYTIQKVRSGDEIVYAVHTTQAGVDYHLMLRRIQLAHRHYLNIRTGLHQILVHTNIPGIKLDLTTDYLSTRGL